MREAERHQEEIVGIMEAKGRLGFSKERACWIQCKGNMEFNNVEVTLARVIL